MTDNKMLIIVPTRSRPESVAKVVEAWGATGAFDDGAVVSFAIDVDDPKMHYYRAAIDTAYERFDRKNVRTFSIPRWLPMVHKLDTAAKTYAMHYPEYFALGFAGDDHLPRTPGWAGRYINALAEMGTGIVSCPDGYRPDQLPTQWAMTADIVRALGRMVPAPVEHLYCDNAIQDLGRAAGCYRYLDDVLIEHMHPLAKRGQWDEQYLRVNNREQYVRDSEAYEEWKHSNALAGLTHQVMKVRALMAAHRA